MSRLGMLAILLALFTLGCEELPAAPDVPNEIPIATFFFNPVAPINAGQTSVSFSAVGSRDTDGQIASYVWSFGDGTVEETSTEPTMRHVFRDTGARCLNITYGVLLTVVDDKGDRGVASQPVTVTELPAPTSTQCAR